MFETKVLKYYVFITPKREYHDDSDGLPRFIFEGEKTKPEGCVPNTQLPRLCIKSNRKPVSDLKLGEMVLSHLDVTKTLMNVKVSFRMILCLHMNTPGQMALFYTRDTKQQKRVQNTTKKLMFAGKRGAPDDGQ